jgi:hypothetical protein
MLGAPWSIPAVGYRPWAANLEAPCANDPRGRAVPVPAGTVGVGGSSSCSRTPSAKQ